jgi:hypothetical protein
MGIAERIYSLVKGLPAADAKEVLGFAETVKARTTPVIAARRRVNLALFRQHRGRYDGSTIKRDDLYHRAGVR